jgi:hypothetical protein
VYGSDVKNVSTGVLCSVVIKLEREKKFKAWKRESFEIRFLSSVVHLYDDPCPAKSNIKRHAET